MQFEQRVQGTTIHAFSDETLTVSFDVQDENGVDVDLSSLSLEFVVEGRRSRTDLLTIRNADLGKSGATLTVTIDDSVTSLIGQHFWSLRLTSGKLLISGILAVNYAAQADSVAEPVELLTESGNTLVTESGNVLILDA